MKKRSKIVGPAIVGNIVEYYDFGLYAVYTSKIGSLFFHLTDPFLQTLAALATFAVGFFMRPLGGVFFGYIGDIFGRRASLSISIVGMACATLAIGILPSYESIGIFAPILLLCIRLFQGLCVGGEGAGVAIFVLEHTEGYRPGLIGSIVMASNMVGTLLAIFVGILLDHFCQSEHCWRYAFVFGGFTGFVGLYLRYQLSETPQFIERKSSNSMHHKYPIIEAVRRQWPNMLVVMCLGGLTTAVAYTIRGYFTTFFLEVMHYSNEDSLYFTSFALFVMIVTLPLFGLLSDKTGHRKFLNIVCLITFISVLPLYMMVANPDKDAMIVLAGLLCFGCVAAALCAPAYSYAIKSFEVELRFSGVAVSWNIGVAVMGGTTPGISHFLSEKFAVYSPAYYIMGVVVLFMIVNFLTRKSHQPNG